MHQMIEEKSTVIQKVMTGIGALLCVVFGFLLFCNITILIKGAVNPEVPPSVFGVTPMVVQSGSMSGTAKDHIEEGDLIFVTKANVDDLKKSDIIAFMEESIVITHRIVDIETDEAGEKQFITKGDANNSEDELSVKADKLVGIYQGRIPRLGDFAIFLQTPLGMMLFVGVPLLAFIIYDILRRQRMATHENRKAAEMEAELQRLRDLAGEEAKGQ